MENEKRNAVKCHQSPTNRHKDWLSSDFCCCWKSIIVRLSSSWVVLLGVQFNKQCYKRIIWPFICFHHSEPAISCCQKGFWDVERERIERKLMYKWMDSLFMKDCELIPCSFKISFNPHSALQRLAHQKHVIDLLRGEGGGGEKSLKQ